MQMYPFKTKVLCRNDGKAPLTIYVEPWANDYTLLAGEELEIVAFGKNLPWFALVSAENCIQVYCEETSDFKVFQGDKELQCGHNRAQ
jgi:hypothetical protein